MDMSDMSSMDSNSSMSTMSAIFFASTTTPLYSASWTPMSGGSYAGTCLFLVLLSIALRALFAVKNWQESAWLDAEFRRRYVVVAGKPTQKERILAEAESEKMKLVSSENGIEEDVVLVRKTGVPKRPWRMSVDPVRAVLDTVIAGVGYLLMLAVMTMNVGYFLSVLAGTFVGSLAVGRYTVTIGH